jgi:hypothetical protein
MLERLQALCWPEREETTRSIATRSLRPFPNGRGEHRRDDADLKRVSWRAADVWETPLKLPQRKSAQGLIVRVRSTGLVRAACRGRRGHFRALCDREAELNRPKLRSGSPLGLAAAFGIQAQLKPIGWLFPVRAEARTRRHALIVSLVAALAALGALAHSDPPDPTWIPGVWDNADYDDVIILATSLSVTHHIQVVHDFRPLPSVVATVALEDNARLPVAPLFCYRSRAPPFA